MRMLKDCQTMEDLVKENLHRWGCSDQSGSDPPDPLRQPCNPKSIDQLYKSAKDEAKDLLKAMRDLVENAGGTFLEPPLKGRERVEEKTRTDYKDDTHPKGDYSRVLDVVRATGVWGKPDSPTKPDSPAKPAGINFSSITTHIASAADDVGKLRVVRCKNRFSKPSGGYRDVMLNVQLKEGGHIGELQLQLQELLDVKPIAHVSYELVRDPRFKVI